MIPAYIVRNGVEFDYIDKKFLKKYFFKIDASYNDLISEQCDGIKQDLIIYSQSTFNYDKIEPGWDTLNDYYESLKENRAYVQGYQIIEATSLMRGPKLKHLNSISI